MIPVKEKLSPATTAKPPKSEGKAVDENWGNAPSGQQGARIVLWALALIVPVLAIVTAFVLINQDPPETPSEGQLNFNFNQVCTNCKFNFGICFSMNVSFFLNLDK